MRVRRAAVDVLFPTVRARLLRLLFSLPPRRFHVRDLARRSELALSTVQEELHNLTALGVLTTSSNRYHRFYAANSRHPLFEPLSRIVHMSERLPLISRSARYRPQRHRGKKQRATAKVPPLPPNRPPGWDLFQHRKPTWPV